MASLNEHTLLYDSDCPLCQAYSSAFIRAGFLDEKGRIPFHEMKQEIKSRLDMNRARHEIALLNRKSGEVLYGTSGLVKILASKIPLIGTLFKFSFIHALVNILYNFVSYNRKVIMPFRKNYSLPSCAPDYHTGYRISFVLFSGFLTAAILQFAGAQHVFYITYIPAYAEYWIVLAQWLFQLLVLRPATIAEAVTYMGQLQTVSLAAAFVILPAAVIAPYLGHPGQALLAIVFAGAVAQLFFWYKRRMNLLHFPKRMTYSWIVFRFVLMFALFEINK